MPEEDCKRISLQSMSFRTHPYCEWHNSVDDDVDDMMVCNSLK